MDLIVDLEKMFNHGVYFVQHFYFVIHLSNRHGRLLKAERCKSLYKPLSCDNEYIFSFKRHTLKNTQESTPKDSGEKKITILLANTITNFLKAPFEVKL